MATHLNDPIDNTPGRLAGNSRQYGDASPEVIAQVQQIIIDEAHNANLKSNAALTEHDIAYILAIAEIESGFNPDAANLASSAFGLGQTVDSTAKSFGVTDGNDRTAIHELLVSPSHNLGGI